MSAHKKHPFHLVPPSPWPFCVSMALIFLGVGSVLAMHGIDYILFIVGALGVMAVTFAWFRDIIQESRENNTHTKEVQLGLKIGAGLFIFSEFMLFFAFFWSYFNAALFPIAMEGDTFIRGTWPPAGIKTLPAFDLPYFNTLLLLLSGTTLTWAHHELIQDNMEDFKRGLAYTLILGLIFLCVQVVEYTHATFAFTDGIYASTFYMATGLHGAHVFLGLAMLAVCYVRAFKKGDQTPTHHVGFETSAWYWHFVDVVWLFLFVAIYWWGSIPRS
ncbi:MAG: cytochrome c oxidase subunit 3 [Alphaproteobacteria bacterium]|nr:cytochrome c oxidase subunit 3 [Alphaproteobacteria bacterium]